MRSIALLRLAVSPSLLAHVRALPALAQQDQSADPVADAARKARAQQKKRPARKKGYTNDDIPSAPSLPLPQRQALRRRLASRRTPTLRAA